MTPKKQPQINRDPELLNPRFLAKVTRALHEAEALGYPVRVFEGYRSALRQDWLFDQGRGSVGTIVTKAKGWQSTHQYGLAVDIAFYINGRWTWDGAFDKVAAIFQPCGLTWGGSGDGGHFEMTGGLTVKECEMITKTHGLLELWRMLHGKT